MSWIELTTVETEMQLGDFLIERRLQIVSGFLERLKDLLANLRDLIPTRSAQRRSDELRADVALGEGAFVHAHRRFAPRTQVKV
jgi:hypothetical protein